MQLKKIIYEQEKLVLKDKVTEVYKKDYNELMSKLEKHMAKSSDQG